MKHLLFISFFFLLSFNIFSQNGKIKGENVNLRSDTSLISDNVIKQLNCWHNISIIEKGAEWTKIKHLDDIGYVYSEFVTEAETNNFSKFIDSLSVYQILLIAFFLTSFFFPRFIMKLLIKIESQNEYEYSERKITEKMSSFLSNTKIEKFYQKLIGNSIYETSSWVLRVSSLLIIPILFIVVKIFFDNFILKEPNQINLELLISSKYNLVLSSLFLLTFTIILAGMLYESIIFKSKIELIRVPLLLVLSFYMIPIAFYALFCKLIIILFIVFTKIIKETGKMLPMIILTLIGAFFYGLKEANRIGHRRDEDFI